MLSFICLIVFSLHIFWLVIRDILFAFYLEKETIKWLEEKGIKTSHQSGKTKDAEAQENNETEFTPKEAIIAPQLI